MTLQKALENTRIIRFLKGSPQVVETIASELRKLIPEAVIEPVDKFSTSGEKGVLNIAIASRELLNELKFAESEIQQDRFIYLRIDENDSGWLITSHPYYLYSFVDYFFEHLTDQETSPYLKGRVFTPAFDWQRISYDFFLTQEGRIQRDFDRAAYVRELARLGFTHIEVNGLAFPMGLETGPRGEAYPMFYTYCPALDQFVFSRLNKGLYPYYYLSANLEYLKTNAELAVRYGLTPGLLCFEPRSVPERFFDKYPMLRGARVDHPFRSFKPRYNITITHPLVREHYAEMLQKLMREVPELGYITIWTNDSGAGFEHTKSLYVGRNGGAYMIREWKDDEEIARLAGENTLRFFHVLRDAGREINPGFRVITRMESFYGEHDTVWNGLEDGIEIETTSLLAKGWDMPYTHPRYPDSKSINGGTVYQQQFDEGEKSLMDDLGERDSQAHFYFAAGPNSMFAPLTGVPYPYLTYKRLKTMHNNGVRYLSHTGGISPPASAPLNVNHEVTRRFQFDPEMDIEKYMQELVERWAGEDFAAVLIQAWKLTEDSILAFPNISPLYSTFGFAWYRLWVRPFVPNIEAIPQEERGYYERFMCTTPHNPNNVDLSRDVLFQLTTPEKSRLDVERIDANLWKPLDNAIHILAEVVEKGNKQLGRDNIIHDQWIRLRALRCWFMTQRNVAAWIAGVYGYMSTEDETEKNREKEFLNEMMDAEIRNSYDVIELLETGVEFMAMTDKGETPLIYGDNLKELILKRIQLMKAHMDDEPYIDHNYIERKAGEVF